MDYDDKPSVGEAVCCVGRSPLNFDASVAKHLYLVPWIVMAITSWILRLVPIGLHRIHRIPPSIHGWLFVNFARLQTRPTRSFLS